MPCGFYELGGSELTCDCEIGQFLGLTLDFFQRTFVRHKKAYCSSPESLKAMSITDVWVNNTLPDEMICDIVDNCTKT